MKKCSRILIPLIALLFFLLPSNKATASHAAGGEIIYEWLGNNDYRFFFKFYRDCTGIAEPGNVIMCAYDPCNNQRYNIQMNKWSGLIPPYNSNNGDPVTAGCSQYKTNCDSPQSPIRGYREWWYAAVWTLPAQCNSWKFSVSISARNTSQNIGGGLFYVETTFNNQLSVQNSSPYFSVKPIPYVCINQPYTFNNGAVDPDNDSLVSEIVRPLTGPLCNSNPVQQVQPAAQGTMAAITWPGNPIQTSNQFSLNQQTGQMTFTPTALGAATLTIRTREYRNGVEIGSIMRDVQVQVMRCTTQAPDPLPDPPTGGGILNGVYQACIDQEIDFCFDIQAKEEGTILILEDNLPVTIPGAKMTYTNQRTDTVTACFKWTPKQADQGSHSFVVLAKDSTCKPPGILITHAFNFSIFVWGETKTIPDTNICPREAVFLGVTGGDQYQWTVVPGGDQNSLSNPNIPNPTATPSKTTTYVVTSTANAFCNNNKDSVTIEVLKGPEIEGQDDTVICPNFPVHLDVKLNKQPGVNYTINWTPGTYLNNTTIPNPTANANSDITYIVELGSTLNNCKAFDTINVDVLDGFSIDNPDTAVCLGDIVNIRGTGDTRYRYEWTLAPATGGNISDPSIVTPAITASNVGTTTYTLTAKYTGCKDSVAKIKIETQPIPQVKVDEDASICYGDTMKLNGIVEPTNYNGFTYKWAPGASLDKDFVVDPIFSGTTTTTLILTASTEAGCTGSDTVTLTVFPADFLLVDADTTLCPGDSVMVNVVANGVRSFQWSPDFNISNTRSLNPYMWPVTSQEYMVYGIDTNDCADTAYVNITVAPRAILSLPDTVTLYPGEGEKLAPEGNCLYYSWFPPLGLDDANSANPFAKPEVNTRYIVQGRTEAGCLITDSIDVLVMPDSYIEIPNAFVPGSGKNNVLRILRRGDVELKRFAIYNRWGERVFETKDVNEGWDGRYNGEIQPMGVYIYTIEAVTPSGRPVNKQGNITLIR